MLLIQGKCMNFGSKISHRVLAGNIIMQNKSAVRIWPLQPSAGMNEKKKAELYRTISVCMNRFFKIICLLFYMLYSIPVFSQSQRPQKHNHPSGKQHAVYLGAVIPFGNFSSTHNVGFSASYAWSGHRFGDMDVKPVKPFGFTAESGFGYHSGKKETVSGYTYNYPRHIFIHTNAGVIYNPWSKGNIRLTAGPAIGIYSGHTRFTIGSCLEGSYYFSRKWAVSPAINLIKEPGADPLWAASLKAAWTF